MCKKAKYCWALSTNFSFLFSWYFFLIMFCFLLNWPKKFKFFKIAVWRIDFMKRNFRRFIFNRFMIFYIWSLVWPPKFRGEDRWLMLPQTPSTQQATALLFLYSTLIRSYFRRRRSIFNYQVKKFAPWSWNLIFIAWHRFLFSFPFQFQQKSSLFEKLSGNTKKTILGSCFDLFVA